MTSRERIRALIAREPADRTGFWLGNPHPDTWPIYLAYFEVPSQEALRLKVHDDFRWISPQLMEGTYRHPEGKVMFDLGLKKHAHGDAGPFVNCESVEEVYAADWPNPDYLYFDDCIAALRHAGAYYRASGFWTCFYHNIMDLFGMEAYMTKMFTHPDVVHAVTDQVCGFYFEANERFFEQAGDLVDGFFFGNDFGTQWDLICTPDQFDEFIMPWFRRFTEQGHRHGYQVILHSCGAIWRVIDRLIDAGVDCLHPLQARASGMAAAELAQRHKGRITFLGGVDTQEVLVHATPEEVAVETCRVRDLLGPYVIVSPSHEALLPNVPPENVVAMAEAATGIKVAW
jgi:uroporphyrinogen decarboxylase